MFIFPERNDGGNQEEKRRGNNSKRRLTSEELDEEMQEMREGIVSSHLTDREESKHKKSK